MEEIVNCLLMLVFAVPLYLLISYIAPNKSPKLSDELKRTANTIRDLGDTMERHSEAVNLLTEQLKKIDKKK